MTFGYCDLDVAYIIDTFPIVKRKDEKQYGEYRTKQVILEMDPHGNGGSCRHTGITSSSLFYYFSR